MSHAPIGHALIGHAVTGQAPIGRHGLIERVTGDDLMSLVSRRHPPPAQVGAVLILDVRDGLDVACLRTILRQRIAGIPRLRQRLEKVPLGCGRPIWLDDPDFNLNNHLTVAIGQVVIDDAGLWDIAAGLVTKPLPDDRPLWSATCVPHLTGGRAALILVMHHVVGDGLAGLAVLAGLLDGLPLPTASPFPRARPTRAQLARDALVDHSRSLRQLPKQIIRLLAGVDQLRPSLAHRAQQCSLNRPTGPRRQVRPVVVDVKRLRALAHSRNATVNDLVLTAVTGALRELLSNRGEHLETLVVSVPFASRKRSGPVELGNQSGVIPVALPAGGSFPDRLSAVAKIMRVAKEYERGASTAVLGPVFRLLARIGLYQYFIDHQPLVHTFVSDLRGPEAPLRLLGCHVLDVVPLSVATGNVTVSFTALSYAHRLVITVTSDPETCPDADQLCQALEFQLAGS